MLTIILLSVLSIVRVVRLGGSVHLLLPVHIPKLLSHFSKIYLLWHEPSKRIKLTIQCEGPVIIRL